MNKKRIVAFLLGATIITGIAFNAATTAKYTQDLGRATQTINAASWDVQMGNTLGNHTIFPGDEISNDTITLTNNNDYAVKFEVRLKINDDGLHNALTFDLKDGETSTGILRSGGIYTVTVAPNSNRLLNSYVKWQASETEKNDIELEGTSVVYNYNIVAVSALEEGRPVYVNNFNSEADLAGWNLNGSPEGAMSFVDGGGMNVKGGIFTRFDGYRTDGTTMWSNETVVDISGLESLEGFDYSMAINSKENKHLQDFVFHIYKDSEGKIYIDADNSSTHKVPSHIVNNSSLGQTSKNTLKFIQNFYPNESGKMICEMIVKDNEDTVLFTKTIQGSDKYNVSNVGGYRYGWFLGMGKNETGKESAGLTNGFVVKSSKVEVQAKQQELASHLTASGWGTSNIQLDFNLNKELDLTYTKNFTNIVIDYYKDGEVVYQKNKAWSGYLNLNNDTNQKYPNGALNTEDYENVLPAGRYATAVNSNDNNKFETINKIVVTVTDANGNSTVLEAIRP